MTFRFFEAEMIVGEKVGASSAWTSAPAAGSSRATRAAASCAGGTSPSIATRNASTSGPICGSGRNAAIRSMSFAALTSALSAMAGIDAWPARPCTRRRNGAVIFSATVTS